MSFSYSWSDSDQTALIVKNSEGVTVKLIPVDPANSDYAEFLSSGTTAAAYVEPEPPAPLTPEQKLEQSGLTVDELKGLLGL